jgi:hypothetical protein
MTTLDTFLRKVCDIPIEAEPLASRPTYSARTFTAPQTICDCNTGWLKRQSWNVSVAQRPGSVLDCRAIERQFHVSCLRVSPSSHLATSPFLSNFSVSRTSRLCSTASMFQPCPPVRDSTCLPKCALVLPPASCPIMHLTPTHLLSSFFPRGPLFAILQSSQRSLHHPFLSLSF